MTQTFNIDETTENGKALAQALESARIAEMQALELQLANMRAENAELKRTGTIPSLIDGMREKQDTNKNWSMQFVGAGGGTIGNSGASTDVPAGSMIIVVAPEYVGISSTGKSVVLASGTMTVPVLTGKSATDGSLTVSLYRPAEYEEVIVALKNGSYTPKAGDKRVNAKLSECRTFIAGLRDAKLPESTIKSASIDRYGEKLYLSAITPTSHVIDHVDNTARLA